MNNRWVRFLGVSLCLTVAAGAVRAQQDEARALVDKAIKAHGGEKAMAKVKAAQVSSKGTVHQMGGIPFTAENYWQDPDKFKSVVKVTINGKNYTETQAFDGKK